MRLQASRRRPWPQVRCFTRLTEARQWFLRLHKSLSHIAAFAAERMEMPRAADRFGRGIEQSRPSREMTARCAAAGSKRAQKSQHFSQRPVCKHSAVQERREAFREREKPELRHPDDLQPPSRRFKRGRVFVCR